VAYSLECGLPACRGVGHHAPSIRLGDLDFSIALSLENHRRHRTSIIDSIVGEFPAALLACSSVILFSAISNIVHLHILLRQDNQHVVRNFSTIANVCTFPGASGGAASEDSADPEFFFSFVVQYEGDLRDPSCARESLGHCSFHCLLCSQSVGNITGLDIGNA
jgi:hypothetical protein